MSEPLKLIRIPSLKTVADFRQHVASLGVDLPCEDTILTGSASPLEFHPLPVDDPKTRQPDIRQARSLLHWEPEVLLEEGLQKTIAYFITLMKAKA